MTGKIGFAMFSKPAGHILGWFLLFLAIQTAPNMAAFIREEKIHPMRSPKPTAARAAESTTRGIELFAAILLHLR